MSVAHFITWIFCWVDDFYPLVINNQKLRQRGFATALSDPEVITMELVGEFLGKDANTHIWSYFTQHWKHFFPALGSRSQFAKQAANLAWVKEAMLEKLMSSNKEDNVHIIDGFPLTVTHFKRAKNSKIFKGDATYGHCASKGQTYFGFKGHLLVNFNGMPSGFELTGAADSERAVAEDLSNNMNGLLLGDKGYLSKELKIRLGTRGVQLETPVRNRMKDSMPKKERAFLNRVRRKIETVIGQLAEQFNIERTRARNMWSLQNRLIRKLLAFSLCTEINKMLGRSPLHLAKIIG